MIYHFTDFTSQWIYQYSGDTLRKITFFISTDLLKEDAHLYFQHYIDISGIIHRNISTYFLFVVLIILF